MRVLLLWSPASQALLSFFSESRDYAFIGTNRERPALPLRVLVSLGHVDKPSGSLVSVGSGLFDMACTSRAIGGGHHEKFRAGEAS